MPINLVIYQEFLLLETLIKHVDKIPISFLSNFVSSDKPLFWVAFLPSGSFLPPPRFAREVKADPSGAKTTQKKVSLTKRNFPWGFPLSMMERNICSDAREDTIFNEHTLELP